MNIIRGVDGCPAGWISVSVEVEGGTPSAKIYAEADALFRESGVAVTAIDIPIGLPSAKARACDEEARRLLGPRKSSVFPAPVRATFVAESYEAACIASRTACGKKLSKQTYAILPKIRDVDAFLRQSSEPSAVFEVHPEVCFYFWNARKPMSHPKKSGFGFVERLRLVEQAFGAAAESVRQAIPRKAASDDDILDAFAALWTARRIHANVAARVGSTDESDEHGLPMQMWA